ncbi:hypothetical protein [Bacteroides sp.]|uniref:hypothetical protein n=1 Tax=Bacteroides sp. TaxID=29523 RepID=UPI00258630DF|nr:hypothetical protein [Bacteroides sp.]
MEKRDPRNPRNPRLKNYLHAEGKPCSSATLVNYHLYAKKKKRNDFTAPPSS